MRPAASGCGRGRQGSGSFRSVLAAAPATRGCARSPNLAPPATTPVQHPHPTPRTTLVVAGCHVGVRDDHAGTLENDYGRVRVRFCRCLQGVPDHCAGQGGDRARWAAKQGGRA